MISGQISGKSGASGSLQPKIEARGLEIFARMNGQKPGVFRNIAGRLMDWSMRNDPLKMQLFRFVDVLPTLNSPGEIARHAQEYLGGVTAGLPAPVLWGVGLSPKMPCLAAFAARPGVGQMAKTFIVARNCVEAVSGFRKMRRKPLAFTMY